VAAREYYSRKERCIFCDLIARSWRWMSAVVIDNGRFVAIAPFASRFPFELADLPEAARARFRGHGRAGALGAG
jgi:UDPglucose--hexose-1-phosphate uridylyltransferase